MLGSTSPISQRIEDGEDESFLTKGSDFEPIFRREERGNGQYLCYILTIVIFLLLLISGGIIREFRSGDVMESTLLEPVLNANLGSSQLNKRELSCIDDYIGALRKLNTKMHNLQPFVDEIERSFKKEWKKKTSDQKIIIGNGCGTTATHAAAIALWKLGLNVAHWRYKGLGQSAMNWKSSLMMRMYVRSFGPKNIRQCHEEYDKIDFRFPLDIDAITDSPTAEHFWDLYRTYPNARFVLTTRNGTEWATKRSRNHGRATPPIIWRPCGLQASHFTVEDHAKAFDAYNNFVQCVVPPERLLSICFLCHKVKWGTFGDLASVNTSDFGIDPEAPIEKFDMPEEALAHLVQDTFKPPDPLRINICAGILYGDFLHEKNIKYFVDYHRKIKVGKVFGFIHPKSKLELSMKGFQLDVWEEDFDFGSDELLKQNQEKAKLQCISQSKDEGFDWTFVMAFDDFLYFNLSYVATLWGLMTSLEETSQFQVSRKHYEVGECREDDIRAPIIWDMPYSDPLRSTNENIWIVRPDVFTGFDSNVAKQLSLETVHVKHYDKYWKWKRKCNDKSKVELQKDENFQEWKRYLRYLPLKLWI